MSSAKKTGRYVAGLLMAAALAFYWYANKSDYLLKTYDPVTAEFTFFDGSSTSQTVIQGNEIFMPEPQTVDNYSFLGWYDADGNIESGSSYRLYENVDYTAKYIVRLGKTEHEPYIFADDEGYFHLDESLSRKSAAKIIYSQLAAPVKGETTCKDIDPSDDYYDAVAALTSLGAFSGDRFRPDEDITKGELISLLTAFYPAPSAEYSFADIDAANEFYRAYCIAAEQGWIESGANVSAEPDKALTLADAIVYFNSAFGRQADHSIPQEKIGGILEYYPEDALYWEVAEAAVSHTYTESESGEQWSSSKPLTQLPSGFTMVDMCLHYVDEYGHFAKNTEIGSFSFDDKGRYTSGMPELDELVRDVLSKNLTSDMTQEQMLKVLYDYVDENFKYIKKDKYEFRDVSWKNKEAYALLSSGHGNCYSYAGAFCELARAIGYDAEVYSGFVGHKRDEHGWVEIEIDGVRYVFDPETEMAYRTTRYQTVDTYMMTYEQADYWTYER